jgi:hypothetical protein
MLPELHFDERTHTYRIDGQKLASVTEVIKPLYDWGMAKMEVLEHKAEIGKAVHKACELHDKGELDVNTVSSPIAGYYRAYLKFLAEVKPSWWLIEQPMGSQTLGLAGTPDRVGLLNDNALTLVDIKSTVAIDTAVGVQLAGYRKLIQAVYCDHPLLTVARPWRRLALQLRPDETYRLVQFDQADDFQEFDALLTHHYYWKKRHAA